MQKMKWYKGTVIHGEKLGRMLGFPTINISTDFSAIDFKQGVYAAHVLINGKEYAGSLFYGPRKIKKETNNVIEVFLLDFSGDLYEENLSFCPVKYIREVRDFDSYEELAKQIEEDVERTREILERSTP